MSYVVCRMSYVVCRLSEAPLHESHISYLIPHTNHTNHANTTNSTNTYQHYQQYQHNTLTSYDILTFWKRVSAAASPGFLSGWYLLDKAL
jgi:hypothetical protein